MPDKTCTTCKHINWLKKAKLYPNNGISGICKKLPNFITHEIYICQNGNLYALNIDEWRDDKEITDCNLWEAKK